MTRKMRVALPLAVALTMTGCLLPVDITFDDGVRIIGSGRLATEVRSVRPFDGVAASGAVTVRIVESGFEGVRVSAEDNLLPYLETRVSGGLLLIGFRSGVSVAPRREIVVEVDAYEVAEVRGSGAVHVEAALGWTPELTIGLSGASNVTISGETDVLRLALSGASRFDGLDYRAERAEIGVSGASTAFVWVRDRMTVNASGASHVRFRGRPYVTAAVSGLSTVRPY